MTSVIALPSKEPAAVTDRHIQRQRRSGTEHDKAHQVLAYLGVHPERGKSFFQTMQQHETAADTQAPRPGFPLGYSRLVPLDRRHAALPKPPQSQQSSLSRVQAESSITPGT